MLPTPSTAHVNYNQIYEPAEDSYLLLDTLSLPSEVDFLHARLPPDHLSPIVLEVGTGSGVVLAFINTHSQTLFGRRDVATLGIDLNPLACAATRRTVELAAMETSAIQATSSIFLDALQADLTSPIKPQSIDVLLFNPPYVPSEELPVIPDLQEAAEGDESMSAFDRDSKLLALSTDGGIGGMETTNRLLAELPHILSPRGVAYVLLCAQNKPDQVIARVQSWPSTMSGLVSSGWSAQKVNSSGKKAGWERLCIVRICRTITAT